MMLFDNKVWEKRQRLALVLSLIVCIAVYYFKVFAYASFLAVIPFMLRCTIYAETTNSNISSHWRTIVADISTTVLLFLLTIRVNSTQSHLNDLIENFTVIAFIFNSTSSLLIFLLPVPSGTPLTGEFKLIGTLSFDLTIDHKHAENIGDIGAKNTSLPVQCWFPLKKPKSLWERLKIWLTSHRALLWTSGHPLNDVLEQETILNELCDHYKVKSLAALFTHMRLSKVNAIWQKNFDNLAVLNNGEKLPVAIYSHGMFGWRHIHTTGCEQLASHGYIVLAADHLPDSMIARPADLTVNNAIPFSFNCPNDDSEDKDEERAFYSKGLKRRINDLQCLVDFVLGERLDVLTMQFPKTCIKFNSNSASFPWSVIDPKKINLWGHSFGGGAISALSCLDSRINRIAGLDPWFYPVPDEIRVKGSQKASSLYVSSHLWPYTKYQTIFRRNFLHHSFSNSQKIKHQNGPSQKHFDLVLMGSDHQNFCEAYLICNPILIRMPSVIGKDLDPYLAIRSVDAAIEMFFSASDDAIEAATNHKELHHENQQPTAPKTTVDDFLQFCTFGHNSAQKKETRHHRRHPHKKHRKHIVEFIQGNIVHESHVYGNMEQDRVVKKIYEKFIS